MEVKIKRLDDLGQGVAFIDEKVTFIPKTLTDDIVDIAVTKVKKKYNEAKLIDIITPSPARIAPKCPYFYNCGGCQLQMMNYEDTIKYKKDKVTNIFKKNKIDVSFEVVENPKIYNYRNKINLKVVDGKVGFYVLSTHELVEIDACLIASDVINETIQLVKKFNIINGCVTIRCNKDSEVLIVITSDDELNIDNYNKKIKLVGIVINDKIYYGKNYLYETINSLNFKISYDSFFQVNPYVASKLFQIIKENVTKSDNILDLYCGVGTLSLIAACNANSVLGVEVVENAIENAKHNAIINNISNASFISGDVSTVISSINLDFTKIIVDPPRSGLSKDVIDFLIKVLPNEVIYVSCDPQTLVRDYKLLQNYYMIKKGYVLDMFSYTHPVECVSVLSRKA